MTTRAHAGTWRALARGWPVFVPVIVVEAAVQALLVWSDPVPEWNVGFVGLLVGPRLVEPVRARPDRTPG